MKESIKGILLEVTIFFIIICIAIGCVYMQNHKIIFDEENNSTHFEKKETNLTNYEKTKIDNEQAVVYIILSVTLILFVISFDMMNRNERTKSNSKQIENLISPSLAEVIVDGKLDIKNLLMSTIIDLSIRGNIEIINNDTLRLLSTRNLENYEKKIVELIFQSNNIITFKNINNIFKESNEKTVRFSKEISNIKNLIIEKLYYNKIFSVKKTLLNKFVTLFSILNLINLILILSGFFYAKDALIIMNIIVIAIYTYLLLKGTSVLEKKESTEFKSEKRKLYILMICIMVSLILTIGNIIIYKPHMLILILFIVILNIVIIKNSKDVVLTDKGKREKIKLLKLRNYINEYSLIKDRDLNATVVWDKYLAYATAFEIPNRVTDSIYESWYDLNITLQFIDRIL